MPDQFQNNLIRRIPRFANLPSYPFELVTKAFEARRYKVGDYILLQNTQPEGLFIMAQGQAVWIQIAPDGSTSQLGTMQVGQVVHEESLLRENVYATAHLQASQPTLMLVLSRQALLNLFKQHPELKAALGMETSKQSAIPLQFKAQTLDETVLLKTRRHWFAFARWLWIPLLVTVILGMSALALPELAAALIPFALVLGGGIAVYQYSEWANDSFVITDKRVLHLNYTIPTFDEHQREVLLETIQEATADYPAFDIFARLFNYGDLDIKTAGREGNFKLTMMPSPEHLQELIMEDARYHKQGLEARQHQAKLAEVESWIHPSKQSVHAPASPTTVPKRRKRSEIEAATASPASPFVGMYRTEAGSSVYRKHWTIWLGLVILPSFWVLGAVVAAIFSFMLDWGAFGWALSFAAFSFGFVWIYFADWDWRNDFYLLNDEHLIIVNRRPFWQKDEVEQILMANVHSVESRQRGILQRLLKYGDVNVSLLGADAAKLLDNVAFPLQIQAEITRRQENAKRRSMEMVDRQQRDAIKEYMSLYHEVAQNPPMPYETQNNPSPSPFGQRGKTSQNFVPPPSVPKSSSAVPPKPEQGSRRPPKFPKGKP